jgi:WhiB family redox-sensing transcriptional regulator
MAIVGEWSKDAACLGLTDAFFVEKDDGIGIRRAVAICERCRVSEACLAHALETREPYGVWGGLSAIERKRRLRGVSVRFESNEQGSNE